MRVQLPSKQTRARGNGFFPVHVCRICDYIFVIQEGQKRFSERPPLIVQTMLLRQKKMVKLLDCFTCMYIVDGTF